MCPVCFATAALIAGKVTSAGGLAAIAIKKFGGKNAVDNRAAQPDPNFSKKERSSRIVSNSHQRRN
jgi:hypothetical protein